MDDAHHTASIGKATDGCLKTVGRSAIAASPMPGRQHKNGNDSRQNAMALRGIESSRADSSWAKEIRPWALIASSPSVPSVDVPDGVAPIVRAYPRQQEYDPTREPRSAPAVLIVGPF
jgi:hypothetical protein